jgi:hypothetical protein
VSKQDIKIQSEDLLAFVDSSIEGETLTGTSSPPPVSANRLQAFRQMLVRANSFFLAGDLSSCLKQLSSALGKCDSGTDPPDFVQGSARASVAAYLVALRNAVDVENVRDTAYGAMKAQGLL